MLLLGNIWPFFGKIYVNLSEVKEAYKKRQLNKLPLKKIYFSIFQNMKSVSLK